MKPEEIELLAMFAGWLMTFYGVCRRDWSGTLTAMAGLGLASVPLMLEVVNDADEARYRSALVAARTTAH